MTIVNRTIESLRALGLSPEDVIWVLVALAKATMKRLRPLLSRSESPPVPRLPSATVKPNLDLATLLHQAEEKAAATGGHLTLLRFTTHWKCALGTPDLDHGDGRSQVAELPGFPSLEEALLDLLEKGRRIGGVQL